jgi:hypothetical protein
MLGGNKTLASKALSRKRHARQQSGILPWHNSDNGSKSKKYIN